MRQLLLILLVTAALPFQTWSQVNVPFFFDRNLSMEFGAANSIVVHKAIASFQDDIIPAKLWEENTPVKKALGFGYRMGKLFLLDFQEDYLFALVQHEVFGHGARYREFGAENNHYSLNPFFPYGNGSGRAYAGTGLTLAGDRRIAAAIGGVEANQVLYQRLSQQILLGDQLHYRQGMLSVVAPNNQLTYIWLDRFVSDPGDMASYVRILNSRYGTLDKQYSIERLSRQSLVGLLNPLQLFAAWGVVYHYGVQGEQFMPKIPMIKLGNVRYLPIPSLNLTPFGSEYVLTNYIRRDNKLFVAELGVSDGFFHRFYRFGAQSHNTFNLKRIQMNFHLNCWNQPELFFVSTSRRKENQLGASFKTDLMLSPFPGQTAMDFYLQLGYKTSGFVIGEALDQGPILKFGLNFRY